VIAGIQEQNEFHGRLCSRVIVIKVLADLLYHCGQIIYDLIGSIFTIHTKAKVSVNDSVIVENGLLLDFKLSLSLI